MSEEKQIEEMAKLVCTVFDGNCKDCPFNFYPPCPPKAGAERVYNAGYRKQSEVAREIFEEIEKLMQMVINDYKTCSCFGTADIVDYAREWLISELKKKYTEGA